MAKPNKAGNVCQYELCVIFDGALDEKKANALLEKYADVLKEQGGIPGKVEPWGRKPFAYEINKKNEGIYFIFEYSATAEASNEFTRRLGLDESTVRFKVFRKEV